MALINFFLQSVFFTTAQLFCFVIIRKNRVRGRIACLTLLKIQTTFHFWLFVEELNSLLFRGQLQLLIQRIDIFPIEDRHSQSQLLK